MSLFILMIMKNKKNGLKQDQMKHILLNQKKISGRLEKVLVVLILRFSLIEEKNTILIMMLQINLKKMKNRKDLLKFGIMFLVNLILKKEFLVQSIKNFLVKILILVLVLRDGAVYFRMLIVILRQIYFNLSLDILNNQQDLVMKVRRNLRLSLIILELLHLLQQMVLSLIIMVVVTFLDVYYVVVLDLVRIQDQKVHSFINQFLRQQRL